MAASSTATNVSPLVAERFFRAALFFLILTSVATLVSTGKLDPVSLVLAPLAVLYKGFRWLRGYPPELHHRTATWMVALYLGFFPMDVFLFSRVFVAGSSNPTLYAALLAAVHFLLFVMIVRLYSAINDRDAVFLAMLSFADILASAVLTVDTWFLLLFFLFLLFAVATLVGLEMRRGANGAISALTARPQQEKRLTRALSLAALSVAVGAIVCGCAIFFFFPRFSAGYLGHTGLQPTLMTGFSEDMELGQIGEIKKNSSVVMRVETGKPVGYGMLRWRGVALTNFDGKRWRTNDRHPVAVLASANGWIQLGDENQLKEQSGTDLEYTILLEPLATDTLFAPSNVIALRGDFIGDGNAAGDVFTRRNYLVRDATNSISNPFRNYSAVRYSGNSRLPRLDVAKLRQAPVDYPEAITSRYLQIPALDPRIPALAAQITARAGTAYDKARAIESYLRSRYTYSLTLTGKPGDDPLAHFLFETRAGHCEYFASSMTILLRTLNIPSREVNGFLPGEYNDLAGDYIVRASDAHSWVEVYFPENGWITFDPTPPADSVTGFLSRFGLYMDWLELSWNEWIINYDFVHQVLLAQGMQKTSRSWRDSAHAWFDRKQEAGRNLIKSWQSHHGALRFLLPAALLLFLIMLKPELLVGAIRRLLLFWQLRRAETLRVNPQLASRLYWEMLRLLERRGFIRHSSQTPFEFADTISEPALAPALREFTQIYAHARFGGAPCDTTRLRLILTQLRSNIFVHK